MTNGSIWGTGRPNKTPNGWAIRGLRFFGTVDELKKFWIDNLAKLGTVLPPGASFESSIYQPGEDISTLVDEIGNQLQVCFKGTAGTIIPAAKTTDVEQLTKTEIDRLCHFHFGGLFVKCKVVHVVDGDTLHVVTFVPLMELGGARVPLHGREHEPKTSILPHGEYHKTGFFARIIIRTYGYDAIEHDKPEGQLATQLFTEKLNSLNNIIWCQFIDSEKYGRMLATLWTDEKKTYCLNNFLIEEGRRRNIRLAYTYMGGTKSQ